MKTTYMSLKLLLSISCGILAGILSVMLLYYVLLTPPFINVLIAIIGASLIARSGKDAISCSLLGAVFFLAYLGGEYLASLFFAKTYALFSSPQLIQKLLIYAAAGGVCGFLASFRTIKRAGYCLLQSFSPSLVLAELIFLLLNLTSYISSATILVFIGIFIVLCPIIQAAIYGRNAARPQAVLATLFLAVIWNILYAVYPLFKF